MVLSRKVCHINITTEKLAASSMSQNVLLVSSSTRKLGRFLFFSSFNPFNKYHQVGYNVSGVLYLEAKDS